MRVTHLHGDHIGMKKKDGGMRVAFHLQDIVVVKGKLIGRRSYSRKWSKKLLKLNNKINKLNEDQFIFYDELIKSILNKKSKYSVCEIIITIIASLVRNKI